MDKYKRAIEKLEKQKEYWLRVKDKLEKEYAKRKPRRGKPRVFFEIEWSQKDGFTYPKKVLVKNNPFPKSKKFVTQGRLTIHLITGLWSREKEFLYQKQIKILRNSKYRENCDAFLREFPKVVPSKDRCLRDYFFYMDYLLKRDYFFHKWQFCDLNGVIPLFSRLGFKRRVILFCEECNSEFEGTKIEISEFSELPNVKPCPVCGAEPKKLRFTERFFIDIYGHTTLEDIKSIWPKVEQAKKYFYGGKELRSERKEYFQRKIRWINLHNSGKSLREIAKIELKENKEYWEKRTRKKAKKLKEKGDYRTEDQIFDDLWEELTFKEDPRGNTGLMNNIRKVLNRAGLKV